ncbi:hypothetical protein EVAR_79464_1 [Eumeta japonica]|uniref:Uncharacterized protein n=1 Tax=Eumeta variegata TaxID=151549 RepID=A0A4C1UF31_EUMVA|nr:hypothetical protein EVAR_79464_1 [Eumeta japonica]
MQTFAGGDSNAVYDIVIGDESWIHCYDPEPKKQSVQWLFPFEDVLTKRGARRSPPVDFIRCALNKIKLPLTGLTAPFLWGDLPRKAPTAPDDFFDKRAPAVDFTPLNDVKAPLIEEDGRVDVSANQWNSPEGAPVPVKGQ